MVVLCTLNGRLPARDSLINSLKALSSPLCVDRMRTSPPHISSARAALRISPMSSTNAASSMITRPCLPRSVVARDGSPMIRFPDANTIR